MLISENQQINGFFLVFNYQINIKNPQNSSRKESKEYEDSEYKTPEKQSSQI